MKFLIILKSNMKRLMKNKKTVIASFLIPAVLILVFGFIFNRVIGSDIENAVINSDKGQYGQEFIKEIQKNTKIKVYGKEAGIEAVKKKRISLCYEIPENFSELISKGEKPQIISYKLENGMEAGNFQFNANSLIEKMLLRNEFKNEGIDVSLKDLSYEGAHIAVTGKDKKGIGDVITLNMLVSFILFSAVGISIDLFHLKRQNILKRSFTTSNKPGIIIGAVLFSAFIVSAAEYIIIFLVNSFINSPGYLSKAPVIILNIMALVLLSLSLGVFAARIFKNENLINVALQMIISVTCFMGGSFMPIEFLPKSITVFSKFTPQYWALQSINTGNAALSLIVVLFALVLFTAGTFRMGNFME